VTPDYRRAYDEARAVYPLDLTALFIAPEGTFTPSIGRLPVASESTAAAKIRPDEVRPRFEELERKWKADTELLSDSIEMVLHPSYQQIIGLGSGALPHILRSLSQAPDHWFWALEAIAGENPVPADARGNLRASTAAWLRWGTDRGYLAA
jgi:hypothetical protein